VAEIRNMFAHKHLALDFGDRSVRKVCDELDAWRLVLLGEEEEVPAEPTPRQIQVRARNQFKLSAVFMGSRMHVDALGKKAQRGKNHERSNPWMQPIGHKEASG
jgi:hypothetical protein